jgi:tetratricopeptide (TPR) repeat protein
LCDVCGAEADRELVQMELTDVIALWDRRDSRAAERVEAGRLRERPSPAEIAEEWIQASHLLFEWTKSQDWTEGDWITDPSLFNDSFPSGIRPSDIYAGFPEPPAFTLDDSSRAAGNLGALFEGDEHFDVFVAFKKALEAHPEDIAIRAAALSFFGSLSRYTPYVGGELIGGIFFDEDADEVRYQNDAEPDLSDLCEARRNVFRAYLTQIAGKINVEAISTWPHARWEILHAYMAEDWDLARALFQHCRNREFLPRHVLAAIECHFEYLLTYGTVIDARLGLGVNHGWNRLPSGIERLRKYMDVHGRDRFSLGSLRQDPRFLTPDDPEAGYHDPSHYIVLVQVPSLDLPVAVLSSYRNSCLSEAARHLSENMNALGSSRFIYRSVLAQCFEALGDLSDAATSWEQTLQDFIDLVPIDDRRKPDVEPLAFRAVDLYEATGNTDAAERVLRLLVSIRPDRGFLWKRLAERKLEQGDLRGAHEDALKAMRLQPDLKDDPMTSLLVSLRPGRNSDAAEARARKWPTFQTLSDGCQKIWLATVNLETEAESVEALRTQYQIVKGGVKPGQCGGVKVGQSIVGGCCGIAG